MIKLTLFEIKKVFSKKSFKIIIFIIFISAFISVLLLNDKEYKHEIKYYENINMLVNEEKLSSSEIKKLNGLIEENNKLYEYTLKDHNYFNKSKYIVEFSYNLLMFLMILLVFLSANIVSSEYQDKTIKLLFTMPYKRWKILFSKFFTIIFLTLFLSGLLSILMIIFTILFNGIDELLIQSLIYKNGSILKISFFSYFFKNYAILLIPVIFIQIFTFSLSTIYLNSTLATIVSLIISITGLSLFSFLLKFDLFFLEYTFLPYLDFTIFMNKINIMLFNIEHNINLNIVKGSIILFIFAVIFYLFANRSFKKDVRN